MKLLIPLLLIAGLILAPQSGLNEAENELIAAKNPLSDAINSDSASQPSAFSEVVANRTRHSKLFVSDTNPDLFRLDVSLAAKHFGSPGAFLDINSSIVPSIANVPQLGTADLEMVQDDFEWFALQTFNAIPLVLFRNKSFLTDFVTFNPDVLQWTNDLDDTDVISQPVGGILGQVTNESLLWPGAYGAGRNLTIVLNPNRMIKLLTLDAAPPAPQPFVVAGGNPAVELQFFFDTASGPSAPDIR